MNTTARGMPDQLDAGSTLPKYRLPDPPAVENIATRTNLRIREPTLKPQNTSVTGMITKAERQRRKRKDKIAKASRRRNRR